MKTDIEETIAGEYITKVLEIEDTLNGGKGIGFYKQLEVIQNFRDNYAKNYGLGNKLITQAENEMNLAFNVYNLIKSKENLN